MEGIGCYKCAFYDKNICIANNPHCTCRSDKKNVIFKKLEKVGEPYEYFIQGMGIIIVQEYILANASYIYDDNRHVVMMDCQNGRIAIEIKQNKEDMKEKKLNLKEFNLEAAKAGKPVCTRDGRKARIICFDLNNKNFPIVAIINCDSEENAYQYDIDGICDEHDNNLNPMMSPEKKEGYVNIYTNPRVGDRYSSNIIFPSKEEQGITKSLGNYINTTKIEWEE